MSHCPTAFNKLYALEKYISINRWIGNKTNQSNRHNINAEAEASAGSMTDNLDPDNTDRFFCYSRWATIVYYSLIHNLMGITRTERINSPKMYKITDLFGRHVDPPLQLSLRSGTYLFSQGTAKTGITLSYWN